MAARQFIPALFGLAGLCQIAPAQPPVPLPGRGPAPLLFVRFSGPAGMQASFFQGLAPARSFAAPVVVGLRPGYIYRVELRGMTFSPGLRLYPTLEVRGSLFLPPRVTAADYPAPVYLTEADVERARAGAMVTKVVYLEDPERAAAQATSPDRPLETDMPPQTDLLAEARELGRPVLILRLGERPVSAEELARCSVPGTILFPGEKALGPAAAGPCLPPVSWRLFDPVLGPRPPVEECLQDGGDKGTKAGLDAEGRLRGVEPEDTVAEYTDAQGRRHVVCSNRVCLCVPRFAILRGEQPLAGFQAALAVNDTLAVQRREQVQVLQPSLGALQVEQAVDVTGRKRPTAAVNATGPGQAVRVEVLNAQHLEVGPLALLGGNQARRLTAVEVALLARQAELARSLSQPSAVRGADQVTGTAVVARVASGPEVVRAVAETRDLTVCCNEAPLPPDQPLVLIKCADRPSAQVGDVVTFTLRYSNHGGRPLTDVAVTDSLTTRLEYVPGSARSDHDAVFTTQENEAGSLILRWEIGGRLLPGQGGVVRFQARVR